MENIQPKFSRNALIEFLKTFQSGRPTCGLPGTLGHFQSLGLDVEKIGYMQNAWCHQCVDMITPMSIKPTFLESMLNV